MADLLSSAGTQLLLMGNEAIARGAIEAGVKFCTSYPGSPSAEVIGSLGRYSDKLGLYCEWSVNEIVALEAAAGGSFANLRAICAMKHNGLNVASDFLTTLAITGCRAGLVVVVCDDPSAHSSTSIQDSRIYAKLANLPLFEPSDPQEAKDMTVAAFDLSERLSIPVLIRSVTRLSHARGKVVLGEIRSLEQAPNWEGRFVAVPALPLYPKLQDKMRRAGEEFNASPFNTYTGPEGAREVVVASGPGFLYAQEAMRRLGLQDRVGVLKLGTLWPLPSEFIAHRLKEARKVLVVEEAGPFLEEGLKCLMAEHGGRRRWFGKGSGNLSAFDELSLESVTGALGKMMGRKEAGVKKGLDLPLEPPPRLPAFCAGCPHRGSFFALKVALKLDGREPLVIGDIGCYTLGVFPTGYFLEDTVHCMGAGIGVASGLGALASRGFERPVIALAGDSTFFHACIPGLINAVHQRADLLFIILDNSATAMTGFQPHPGLCFNAQGREATKVSIEEVCESIGAKVTVADPFRLNEAIDIVYKHLQDKGVRVLILRQECALLDRAIENRVWVDQDVCIGEGCGCVRFCERVFTCPALTWDRDKGKARVDEIICTGCGLCLQVCPTGAIRMERLGETS